MTRRSVFTSLIAAIVGFLVVAGCSGHTYES